MSLLALTDACFVLIEAWPLRLALVARGTQYQRFSRYPFQLNLELLSTVPFIGTYVE